MASARRQSASSHNKIASMRQHTAEDCKFAKISIKRSSLRSRFVQTLKESGKRQSRKRKYWHAGDKKTAKKRKDATSNTTCVCLWFFRWFLQNIESPKLFSYSSNVPKCFFINILLLTTFVIDFHCSESDKRNKRNTYSNNLSRLFICCLFCLATPEILSILFLLRDFSPLIPS